MITFKHKGDLKKTTGFFRNIQQSKILDSILHKHGQKGLERLKRGTPVDTGLARDSWYYEVIRKRNSVSVIWGNRDIEDNASVIIMINYGHVAVDGSYVDGNNFVQRKIKTTLRETIRNLKEEVSKL